MWNKGFQILDFAEHKNDSTEENNTKYCYTDGSKINKTTGCGYEIREKSKSLYHSQTYLGKDSTVFQAEIVAISRAARSMMKYYGQKVIIRSDSQAALLAINKTSTTSVLVKECVDTLNELSKKNKITLQWIKAHVGHEGNEAADRYAKLGAKEVTEGPEPFLPLPMSFKNQVILNDSLKHWTARWIENPKLYEQTKLWFKRPSKKFISFLRNDRFTVGKLVQFITGHCNLKKHQFRIGKIDEPKCRLCNTNWETPWHLVTECPRLQGIREKYFHGPTLHTFGWSPQLLLRFCKESSIWGMLDGLQ